MYDVIDMMVKYKLTVRNNINYYYQDNMKQNHSICVTLLQNKGDTPEIYLNILFFFLIRRKNMFHRWIILFTKGLHLLEKCNNLIHIFMKPIAQHKWKYLSNKITFCMYRQKTLLSNNSLFVYHMARIFFMLHVITHQYIELNQIILKTLYGI